MKRFKLADFSLQSLVIVICIIATATMQMEFYMAYFITGAAQLLSMLAHECLHYFTAKGSPRRIYHNISYTLVICMALSPAIYVTGIVFVPLLFLAPFMALYYLNICYRETFVYLKRPLSVLK